MDERPPPRIKARYPGKCVYCGERYSAGESVVGLLDARDKVRGWGHPTCIDTGAKSAETP